MANRLGIDLSATSVRVALLSSSIRKTAIVALREEAIADHEDVSAALRAAVDGLKHEACAVALDGRRAFTRRLELPRAALKDLDNVLGFEIEATLPFELNDAVMDHRRIRHPAASGTADTVTLFAGIAAASEVRQCVELVQRGTGIDPNRVGLGSLPLLNLAAVAGELAGEAPVGIVDLTEDGCDVLVMQGGEPRFARSLSRGTNGLPEDAPALAAELKQTLAAWRASGGSPLDRVVVVGPGAETDGLAEFLQSELGVELAALPKLGVDVRSDDAWRVPRFARAIALALSLSRRAHDLNLRQGALEAQQSYQFLREKAPLLAGLATAFLVSVGFAVVAEKRALESEARGLEERLSAVTSAYLGTAESDPRAAGEKLDALLSGKSDDPMPALDGFDALVALSELIPTDLAHDVADLDFKKSQLSLKGLVDTIDDANRVEKAVASHKCFKDVQLSHTTKLKEKNKQKYTLEAKVDCGRTKAAKGSPAPKSTGGTP